MLVLLLIVAFVLVVLFTSIQTCYLESMRLHTRELPALTRFKAEIEPRLKLEPEPGALSFSLWKHSSLVLFAVLALAAIADGHALNFLEIMEAVGGALLGMVLCGYLVPQLLYRRTSGAWIGALLPFYRVSALLVRPFVALLNFMHSLLDIVKQEPAGDEAQEATENIDALIAAGTEKGLIEEEDRKLFQSVVAFGNKTVREVMTPRPDMVTIQADATLEALHSLVVNEQYSRVPVWQESIDDIVGFVHVRDMFEVAESSRASRKVRELMRPIQFVPESKPVDDLMREMQQEGAHMAIVIDEYGNTAGLVTMENLVEVILGEIRDEHEPDTDVTRDEQGGFVVSGNFDLARLPDLMEFKPDEDLESTTIGGLVTEWLGHVPKPGESVARDGVQIEVLASDDTRVERVRLSQTVAAPEPQVPESGVEA